MIHLFLAHFVSRPWFYRQHEDLGVIKAVSS